MDNNFFERRNIIWRVLWSEDKFYCVPIFYTSYANV